MFSVMRKVSFKAMSPIISIPLLTVFMIFSASICVADDLRTTTMDLLVKLRKEGVSKILPDEMRSFDSTVATAELYYQTGSTADAKRHYRLAAQKGTMIRKHLADLQAKQTGESPVPPETTVAEQAQQNVTVPKLLQQDTIVTQSKAEEIERTKLQELAESKSASLEEEIISDRLVGATGEYQVIKGDTIRMVAARLGVNRHKLAAMNGLTIASRLQIGQKLRYNNRRIIPELQAKDGLIINIPDRTLYYFEKGKLVFTTAVALGTPTKTEQFNWQTPTGKFRIVAKEKDPTWTVPPSIQEEMRLEGKEVITSMPPGPDNPLGKYAIRTSIPGILIHSTTKPWSIYTYASHGCIRVYPKRMEELFKLIKVSTPGEIIYRPVKLATTEAGRIFLEVNGDIYSKTGSIAQQAKQLLLSHNLIDRVDPEKVKRVISGKTGIAEEITLETNEAKTEETILASQSPS